MTEINKANENNPNADAAGRVNVLVSQNFNKLHPSEAERLAILAEECGEVVQAIGKILRHGYKSRHPFSGRENRSTLEKECGDVQHAITRLCKFGDLSKNAIDHYEETKALNISQYLHHDG